MHPEDMGMFDFKNIKLTGETQLKDSHHIMQLIYQSMNVLGGSILKIPFKCFHHPPKRLMKI